MIDAGVSVIFWILAFIIIVSALLVVTLKNIFHSALFLILCLFTIAGIYIMLNAEFLAAAQVLIYVGAVSILIIFAIMLTSNLASERIVQSNKNALVAFFVCLMFLVTTIVLINKTGVWNYTEGDLPARNILTIGNSS